MKFELTKPFGKYTVGQVFDSFGGLVCGLSNEDADQIRFDDKNYFKIHRPPVANLIGLAFAIIGELYQDITDRGGQPYIMHLIRVMMNPRCDTETKKVLALLHDCVEDGLITLDQLHARGIPMSIITKINILWHKDYQEYDDYIKLVSSDQDCRSVKMSDLEDNSQITRLKGLRRKDFDRIEKYHRAYTYLSE